MNHYSIFLSVLCILVGIVNTALQVDDSLESLIGILCIVAGSFVLGANFPII